MIKQERIFMRTSLHVNAPFSTNRRKLSYEGDFLTPLARLEHIYISRFIDFKLFFFYFSIYSLCCES